MQSASPRAVSADPPARPVQPGGYSIAITG